MNEYPIVIFWDAVDGLYVADVPDVRYCSAHGETPEEALREVRLALADMLDYARLHGMPLPPAHHSPHALPGGIVGDALDEHGFASRTTNG